MTKQTSSNGNPPVKHTKPVSNAEKFRIQQACMALDHPWMKELRPGSSGRSEIRILFVFDPKRKAIMLVGGDKQRKWDKWYRKAIPEAERRYLVWLEERYGKETDR